ncbi:MAG: hypothetical protein U1A77_02945 [Pirellulales bacterium]
MLGDVPVSGREAAACPLVESEDLEEVEDLADDVGCAGVAGGEAWLQAVISKQQQAPQCHTNHVADRRD